MTTQAKPSSCKQVPSSSPPPPRRDSPLRFNSLFNERRVSKSPRSRLEFEFEFERSWCVGRERASYSSIKTLIFVNQLKQFTLAEARLEIYRRNKKKFEERAVREKRAVLI